MSRHAHYGDRAVADPDRAYDELVDRRKRQAEIQRDWRHGDHRFFWDSTVRKFFVRFPWAWFEYEEISKLNAMDPGWTRLRSPQDFNKRGYAVGGQWSREFVLDEICRICKWRPKVDGRHCDVCIANGE
jgi:hypothetical protein